MNENKELKQEMVDAILEKGVDFAITIANPTLYQRFLNRCHLLSLQKGFMLHPIKMGTLLQIARIFITINEEQLDLLNDSDKKNKIDNYGSFLKTAFILINNDGEKLVKIIAYALYNKRGKPPKRLIRFLQENLDARELLKVLILVVRQMDVSGFLACMVSVTSLNITETRKRKRKSKSTIHGEQSEDLSNTFDSPEKKSSGDTLG